MALSKNEIKLVQSLRLKKFRQKYDNFIAEGEKIAAEALGQSRFRTVRIFAEADWLAQHAALLQGLPAEAIREVSNQELGRISALSTPNKVLLLLAPPAQEGPDAELLVKKEALYLDDIQDPGNFGAILRIADWFAVSQVFRSPGSVEVFNPKVVQASMGAFLRVSCIETSMEALRHANPGIEIMGAALEGENLYEAQFPGRGVLVIGNESQGISEQCRAFLNRRIAIPRAEGGGAESLNAAVATGIIAAFWKKQGN